MDHQNLQQYLQILREDYIEEEGEAFHGSQDDTTIQRALQARTPEALIKVLRQAGWDPRVIRELKKLSQ